MVEPDQKADSASRPPAASVPRRVDRLLTLGALVLVAAYVGVTLLPALAGRGVLLDVGLLSRYLPFKADGISHGAIWCRGDTVDGVLPALKQIHDSLRHGDLPTWTPFEAGGAPLASQPQNNFLNPTIWPYLVAPVWFAPALARLLQVVVAVAGMVAFLGRYGVRRGPALVAGVAFASCGFMVMWNNWPHVAVACFVPALFWAVERAVVEPSTRALAWLAVVVACMLLGGFPAVTLYALTAAGVYAVVRLVGIRRHSGTRSTVLGVLTAGCGVGLGAMLSAVQLLPFARNLGALDLASRDFSASHLSSSALITTVAPGAFGTCADGQQFGAANAVEQVSFAGAAVVVLAAYAVAARPRGMRCNRWLLASILLIAAAAIWIGGPVLGVLQHVPFYSSNAIGRATSITGFLLAALAGIGLDHMLRAAPPTDGSDGEGHPRRPLPWWPVAAAIAAAAAVAGWWTWHQAHAYAASIGRLDSFRSAVRHPLLILAASVLALGVAVALRGAARMVAASILAILVVAQCALFTHALLPLSARADFYPETAAHRFLQKHLGEDRYATGGDVMYPATSDYYGLRTAVGHQFTQPEWIDLLEAVDPKVMESPSFSVFGAGLPDVGTNAVLDELSVRYWVADPGYLPGRAAPRALQPADRTISLARDDTARCTIPGGAVSGVQITLAHGHPVNPRTAAQLHVRVTRADGTTVVGTRALTTSLHAGHQRVGLPPAQGTTGRGATTGSSTVEVWFTGLHTPLELASDAQGHPLCQAVRPNDTLTLVEASAGANIFERPHALPRIRWAGTSEVVSDGAERVRRIAAGLPAGTVLLDAAGTTPGSGASGSVHVVRDEPEEISADVDAQGAGYLVVADSIARAGWTASIDGHQVPIVAGNHAFAAVPVPGGRHRVTLSYTAPGLRAGFFLTATAAVITTVLFALPWRRRRGAPGASPSEEKEGERT